MTTASDSPATPSPAQLHRWDGSFEVGFRCVCCHMDYDPMVNLTPCLGPQAGGEAMNADARGLSLPAVATTVSEATVAASVGYTVSLPREFSELHEFEIGARYELIGVGERRLKLVRMTEQAVKP